MGESLRRPPWPRVVPAVWEFRDIMLNDDVSMIAHVDNSQKAINDYLAQLGVSPYNEWQLFSMLSSLCGLITMASVSRAAQHLEEDEYTAIKGFAASIMVSLSENIPSDVRP